MSKRLTRRQARERDELADILASASARGGKGAPTPSNDRGVSEDGSGRGEDEVTGEGGGEEEEEEEDGRDTAGKARRLRSGPSAGGMFAALNADDAADEEVAESAEEEDDDDSREHVSTASGSGKASSGKKKKKKKKKKGKGAVEETVASSSPGVESSTTPLSSHTPIETPGGVASRSSAKQKGKRKGGAKAKGARVDDLTVEELSRLLDQLGPSSARHPTPSASNNDASSSSVTVQLRSLLSVDPKALDPDTELRRLFGASVVKSFEASQASSIAASARRRGGAASNPNARVRSVLVKPKDTWPPIASTVTGLSMEVVSDGGAGRVYTYKHSRAYKEAQYQFLGAVGSYDPNTLVALLRVFPWHIDTLLQLAEVSRHQDDIGASSDFILRALFAFERAAHPNFSFANGQPWLDFSRIENRPLWLALHRYLIFLQRRGTWRTAMEFARLLLALDPVRDPHGALLHLDFLAIKSRQHAWLLDLIERLPTLRKDLGANDADIGVDWAPGLWWTRALALREKEDAEGEKTHTISSGALREAIIRHPAVVPLLADKLSLPVPQGMRSDQRLRIETRWTDEIDTTPHLLARLYVHRSESLWREPGVAAWLKEQLPLAWTEMQDSARPAMEQAVPSELVKEGIYRHVVVSEMQPLLAFLPPRVTSRSQVAFDPLRPSDGMAYDDAYFSGVTGGAHRRAGGARGILGEDGEEEDEGLIQAFVNSLRDMLGNQQEEWGDIIGGMDDRQRASADMIARLANFAALGHQLRGADTPPGGFPHSDIDEDAGLEEDDDFTTEEEEEEGEEADGGAGGSGATTGLMDNFRWAFDRLLGGQARPTTGDDGSEEEAGR